MEGGSNGGGDKGGAVELQVLEGSGPALSDDGGGPGGGGTFEEERYDGDRLRSRLVALGDLEMSEPEEESQGEIFAQESDHLLNIFPAEIWLMILDNVKDAKTMESLHYASPYFRSHFLPQRELYLFPEVWNILVKKFEYSHFNDPSYNEVQVPESGNDRVRQVRTCENCRRPRKTKWYSGILKLRLVCHTWSAAVDQSLEDPVTRGATPSNDWTFNELPTPRLFQFFQHFADTHARSERSPFLGRHNVIITGSYDQQRSSRLQLGLLDFGRHINSVSISSHHQHTVLSVTYRTLRGFLSSMPNLKVLKINTKISIPPSSLVSFDFLLPMKHSLETLEILPSNYAERVTNKEFVEALVRNQATQMVGFTRGELESNFWSLFPNLKEVKIMGNGSDVAYLYSRGIWERKG